MSKAYTIVMLDSYELKIELPRKANGDDCLEQVCRSVGILEKEYFGLQHEGKTGEPLWINARNPIREQLWKGNKRMYFRIKFFIKPAKIIQPSTREQFYLQLKADLLLGKIRTTSSQAAVLSALVAQIEHGDISADTTYTELVGAQFANSMLHRITAEHQSLTGVSRIIAVERFLNEAHGLEHYGIEMHRVCNGYTRKQQIIGVGPNSIFIYSTDMELKKRFNYSSIQFTAFHGRKFCMLLTAPNYNGPKEYRYELVTKLAAQALYRSITEFHTFFRRETVGSIVKDAGYSTSLFSSFKKNPVDRFYFDVLKTQREVVNHVWPLLHPAMPPVALQRRNTTGGVTRSRGQCRVNPPPPSYTESSAGSGEDRQRTPSPLVQGNQPQAVPLRSTSSPPPAYSEFDNSPLGGHHGGMCLHSSSRLSMDAAAAIISRARALEAELLRLKETMLCRVCKSNPVAVTFCPCGHTLCCEQCSSYITKCPLCSELVHNTQRMILI